MIPENTYTTGEVAKMCRISQRTVIRCFDSGLLRGFRVPGSRFRRIPHSELERFRVEHHLPELVPPGVVQLTLQETATVAGVGGVACRIWVGQSPSGIPIKAHMAHLAAENWEQQGELDRELRACRTVPAEPADEAVASPPEVVASMQGNTLDGFGAVRNEVA